MKSKVYGILMFISVAICGGGIDSGSKMQTIAGLVLFLIFVGGVFIEELKEDIKEIKRSNKRNTDYSYPCFFRK